MLNKFKNLLQTLRCPECHKSQFSIQIDSSELLCISCGAKFPLKNGRPALLRQNNHVFCLEDYQGGLPSQNQILGGGFARFIPNISINLASKKALAKLRNLLSDLPYATVLVVGGGRQRHWLDEKLGVGKKIRVVYSDIDVSADVDLFCDGHDLPFIDGCFDAVVTTAVLEHVMYPERVAAEISRVLKFDGLLYSELPFMQQVHEGAYDFTRYTLSGHRRLFNRFAEIESGLVAGPATALVWAIENLILAFLSRSLLRKLAKATVRISLFWLKYLDYFLVNRPEAMDGASCTYFLGRKIMGTVPDTNIIAEYIGAKHLSHT
jgi:SAM-dependent methyltransferase